MKKKYLIMLMIFMHMIMTSCSNEEITPKENNSTIHISTISENTTSENITSENTTSMNITSILIEEVYFKDKTIVLDPGHGNIPNFEEEPIAPGSTEMKIKDGGGTTGIITSTRESDINLKVALFLEELLKTSGYRVVLTKRDPYEIPGNIDRAEIGNNENADLVFRIHCDSFNDQSAHGASMLVPKAINDNTEKIYEESLRCGKIILDALCEYVPTYNRGLIYSDQMTGFNWSTVPVVLIEMGFLSNPDEDMLLSSEDYQMKLANGLFLGIEKCFE